MTQDSEHPVLSDDHCKRKPQAVAVIGMACRLPAGATNVENLWTALASGQSGWTPHPEDRYMPEIYYHPNPDKKGCYDSKGGHYVEEDIARFDAQFFNVPAAEAIAMDPQQRQLLEISYEALENAGVTISEIAGTSMGVFIGGNVAEYRSYMHQDPSSLPMFEATGGAEALLSNRISYVFDLHGPSFTVDTACSSSLVALNAAVLSLEAGQSSAAIVGGSNIKVVPESSVSLSTMRLLSSDGRSYAFDDRATGGFGRGEGTSCIILKSLNAALEAGDPVRAIIRSTGTNQDGKTAGITMPNGKAQVSLIRSVYDSVGLDPRETDYVEAHGTGTAVGDPIEAAALGETFGRELNKRPVTVGSLKSNIGHLEGASGVSSVIKTALMLERKFLVPNCDLRTLNRKIPFDKWNMKVARKYVPWDSTSTRRASINNFGFGGANAHVVMEEAIVQSEVGSVKPAQKLDIVENLKLRGNAIIDAMKIEQHLYLFSASDRTSLQRQITAVAAYSMERPYTIYPHLLKALAFTLGQRRSVLAWKVAVPAATMDELVFNLKGAAITPIKSSEVPRIGFLFTGQGSQWPAMGKALYYKYPTYAVAIRKAEGALADFGASWSLVDEIEKDRESSVIDSPQVSQPACTAVQIALVDLLSSWGIAPQTVSGHSSGEIAAAYAAGILDLKSCMAIAYYRGLAATTITQDSTGVSGGMLAVGASQDDTQALIDGSAAGRQARIACVNSPNSMTVSGDSAQISLIQDLANSKSIWNKRLNIGVAYHSHHMNAVADSYKSHLGKLEPNTETKVDFYSSLKGTLVEPSTLTASYWVDNLTSPVLFSQAVKSLCESQTSGSNRNVDMLIEIGPHSALQGPLRQILSSLAGNARNIQSLPSLIRSEDSVSSILRLCARLFMGGCRLRMKGINFPTSRLGAASILTDLPPYQWNHEKRYWHDTRLHQELRTNHSARHDLLGIRLADSGVLEPIWRNVLVIDDVPWLRDHSVQGFIVFPMAAYLCMAMEACRQQAEWKGAKYDRIEFREIAVHQALTIPESGPVELRLSLIAYSEGTRSYSDSWSQFNISSWTKERSWLTHCRGLVAIRLPHGTNLIENEDRCQNRVRRKIDERQRHKDQCTYHLDSEKLYRVSANAGFEYGPSFRQMRNVTMGSSQAVYRLTVPDSVACMPSHHESEYFVHPITLDILLQGAMPFLSDGGRNFPATYVPTAIRELTVATDLTRESGAIFEVYAKSEPTEAFLKQRVFNYTAIDLKNPSAAAITMRGVVEVAVNTSQMSDGDGKARCLLTKWEPCVSYLEQGQGDKIFALGSTNPKLVVEMHTLEPLSFAYIKEALDQTNADSVKVPYLIQLLAWMKKQVDPRHNGLNGKTGQNTIHMDEADRQILQESVKIMGSAALMIRRIGENLSAILQGLVDPLSLTAQDDLFDRYYADTYLRLYSIASRFIQKLAHEHPELRILEIGAGTAIGTISILETLGGAAGVPAKFVRYDLTDRSSQVIESEKVKAKLAPWGRLINYKKLNIEDSPIKQGFESQSYDVVVASNLLSSAPFSPKQLSNIRSLLKDDGKLVLLEDSGRKQSLLSLPFATLPTWWPEEKKENHHQNNGNGYSENGNGHATSEPLWDSLLEHAGFSGPDCIIHDYPDPSDQTARIVFTTAIDQAARANESPPEFVVVAQRLPDGISRDQIEAYLNVCCAPAGVSWIESSKLVDTSLDGKYCIFIDDAKRSYLENMNATTFQGLKRLPEATGILWITGGTSSPNAGLARGFARTLRSELHISNFLVLGIEEWEAPMKVFGLIGKILERSLHHPSQDTEFDTELAIKDGVIYVPRLEHAATMDQNLTRETQKGFRELQPFVQEGRPLKLTISNPGFLDTLCFNDDILASKPLGDDELEIDVRASGLNFKDIILALGQLAGFHLGQECSGVITRVGDSVSNFRPGDRVCAVTGGSFANFARCKSHCAAVLPASMSFVEGASVPIIYCTAHYCLSRVANLQSSDTILIHAAAGGVGQSAIMLAQAKNAKILATVGSPEKKRFLMQTYSIPEECIFYSRDTSFVQGVMEATHGVGVDVVLNSLAGEQLRATWQCMAPFGRFVEIGKRDITSNMSLEMGRFERTVSFTAVDLTDVISMKPILMRKIFTELIDLFKSDTIGPVGPLHEFSVSEIETAFRSLQSGKLLGKLIIVPKAQDMVIATRPSFEPAILRSDVSYLITGGTGGIGRAVCSWMAHHGAKNIILASRSGKTQANVASLVEELASGGVRVEVCQSDVAKEADMRLLISKCAEVMPPIGGVIHGAYVNKDILFEQLEYDDWIDVVQPKVQGAWNLHNALIDHKLDFFVMLSSISGVIGNRGQAAYAAANSFLDAFAHFRSSKGLVATAIDLGVVKEIGYVADRPELQAKLASLADEAALSKADVLALVKLAITGQIDKHADHQCTVGLTFETYSASNPAWFWATSPRFSHLRRTASDIDDSNNKSDGGALPTPKQALKISRTKEAAVEIVKDALVGKLSSVLLVPAEEIGLEKPLVALGLDSLVAVEVRRWIVRELEAGVSTLELMTSPGVGGLAGVIVEKSKLCNF